MRSLGSHLPLAFFALANVGADVLLAPAAMHGASPATIAFWGLLLGQTGLLGAVGLRHERNRPLSLLGLVFLAIVVVFATKQWLIGLFFLMGIMLIVFPVLAVRLVLYWQRIRFSLAMLFGLTTVAALVCLGISFLLPEAQVFLFLLYALSVVTSPSIVAALVLAWPRWRPWVVLPVLMTIVGGIFLALPWPSTRQPDPVFIAAVWQAGYLLVGGIIFLIWEQSTSPPPEQAEDPPAQADRSDAMTIPSL